MSRRTPSREQIKAIEHNGGVLLSAGAGAGKTFVLVEHIYYLIRNYIEKNPEIETGELKEFLAKNVVMTFTKKAAGELEIRMQNYLKEVDEEDILFRHINLLKDSISALNITTIHGFCYLLIQKGLIEKIDSNKEIISDLEFREKINNLVDEWFRTSLNKKIDYNFIMGHKKLKEAFQNIYSSPELRILWHSTDLSQSFEEKVIVELEELLSLNEIYNFEHIGKETEKITSLLEYFRNHRVSKYQDLLLYDDFFSEFGTFPRSKELGLFKDLREFLKKNKESILAFSEAKDTFDNWAELIKSLHRFIEENYLKSGGLNFSDLEYYVFEALENEKTCAAIREEYNYFVIDEFQDTSEIQFNIVSKILNQEFENLFCVGDIKQAIYGFRGGEIKLIKNLSQNIPQFLSLKDNYRSGENVVKFNNDLFSYLLNLGHEFEGKDAHSVPFESQQFANKSITDDFVEKISIEISKQDQKSLSQSELEIIEAQYIVEQLKNNKTNSCILYRKLTPVKYLLPLLIENDLSFSLQMKVNLERDPLWSIFKLLMEGNDQVAEHLEVYFSYLNIDSTFISESLETFNKNLSTIGLWQAFQTFIYSNGIHNSNFENNLSLIESLCLISNNDKIICRERIEDHENGTYSIDFRYGDDSENITIMTIHSSKGLEFDHVILAGISTNGKSIPFDKAIGSLPFSFKWYVDGKTYKSPFYLIEELHKKNAEFSESKRLFYVACTRAVSRLTWFDISLNGKEKSYSKNSWINGLRKWGGDTSFYNHEEVFDDLIFEGDKKSSLNSRPEFHLSNLGIVGSTRSGDCYLSYIPELSVTRFSELALCVRKFFLSNVLKITEEDMENLDPYLSEKQYFKPANEDEKIKSSKARGSDIHYQIEKLIKEDDGNQLSPQVNFVRKILEQYKDNYKFLSEVPVRFSLFGHIVNGTPDLVLVPMNSDDTVEIWDFKTGSSEENNSYWMQLYCYALCFSHDYPNSNFKLKLLYVDTEEVVEQTHTVEEINQLVLNCWSKTKDYSQVNTQHCQKCNFQNLCREV